MMEALITNEQCRILWIAEVLAASAGTIQRYTQTKKDSRGRDKRDVLMLCGRKLRCGTG